MFLIAALCPKASLPWLVVRTKVVADACWMMFWLYVGSVVSAVAFGRWLAVL